MVVKQFKKILEGNLDSTNTHSNQPNDIKLNLRPHQLTLLSAMNKLEAEDDIVNPGLKMGIIGDKVGSGKSIAILSHISNKIKYITKGQTKFKKGITTYKGFGRQFFNPEIITSNLIVVPHSVIHQWEEYVSYTKLNCYFIKKSCHIFDDPKKYNNFDIVICKSTIYNKFAYAFSNEILEHENSKYHSFFNEFGTYQMQEEVQGLQNKIEEVPKLDISRTRLRMDPFLIGHSLNKIQKTNNNLYELTKNMKELLDKFDYETFKDKYFNELRETRKIRQYKGHIWYRVIYDEPDTLNISNCQPIYGFFNWFICSSFENLIFPNGVDDLDYIKNVSGIHRNGYIRNLFREILYTNHCPEQMNHYILKNQDSFVEESLKDLLNELHYNYWQCRTPKEVLYLNGLINKDMINSLNAGDIKGVLEKINCDIKTEENLVKLYTHKWVNEKLEWNQKLSKSLMLNQLYNKFYNKYVNNIDIIKNKDNLIEYLKNKIEKITNSIKYLDDDKRKIKNQIKIEQFNKFLLLVNENVEEFENFITNTNQELNKNIISHKNKIKILEEKINSLEQRLNNDSCCPICLCDIENKTNLKCCKNNICFECLIQHLNIKKSCPLCRASIDNNDKIIYIDNKDEIKPKEEINGEYKKLDKFSTLKNLISDIIDKKKKDSRILVFSEYDNSFESINKFFTSNDINYSRLNGTSDYIKK